jgi:hypothetical protein
MSVEIELTSEVAPGVLSRGISISGPKGAKGYSHGSRLPQGAPVREPIPANQGDSFGQPSAKLKVETARHLSFEYESPR